MRRRALVVVPAIGAALVAVSLAPARPGTPEASRTVVTVSMFDLGFKLSRSVVRPGTVIFRTRNDGAVVHDLRFRRIATKPAVGTPLLDPGERATLEVRFAKPGRYPFVCTVAGHAAAGMKGTLVVR